MLLVTRLPLVDSHPSFVVIQRAQAYGYATEYIGWVFNRSELLEEATASGITRARVPSKTRCRSPAHPNRQPTVHFYSRQNRSAETD